jgi:hypothetical protein
MPLAWKRSFQAFTGRVDDDQYSRSTGIRVAGASDEFTDLEASMELIVKDGVDVITGFESFWLANGQV